MKSTLRWSIVLLLSAMPALGGGPRNVNGLGQPMAWPPGTISYSLDPGPLGQLNNTAAPPGTSRHS